jgi:hypothetical protein
MFRFLVLAFTTQNGEIDSIGYVGGGKGGVEDRNSGTPSMKDVMK